MKPFSSLFAAFSAAAVLVLAACSGHSSLPPDGGPPLGNVKSATLTVTIHVAKRVPASGRRGRGPRWVSPSSQSVSLSFATSGRPPAVFNINLGSNCKTVAGAKTCSETLSLPAAHYDATVTTYDALNEGGNILSRGESIPAIVVTGKANTINLTLGGVPHSIALSGATGSLRGSAGGMTLYNAAAQLVTITAKDADGNTIVGAGTPWVGSVNSGSGWSIQASPSPAHVNQLAITPPNSNGSVTNLKIAANYDASICSASGVACTVNFNVTNDVQILAVTDCLSSLCSGTGTDSVFVYDAPYTGSPVKTITNGVSYPISAVIARNGTIFVGNCPRSCAGSSTDSVTVYAPPYTSAPTTITTGIGYPQHMAVNSDGDLFVDNCNSCEFAGSDVVTEYSHLNYAGAPVTLSGLSGEINGLIVDSSQDLLVAICRATCAYLGSDAILMYAAAYTGAPTAITNSDIGFGSNPAQMAFDSDGNLYVPTCLTCFTTTTYQVTKLPPPYSSSTPVAINPGGAVVAPIGAAVDVSNNLFVANGPGGSGNGVFEMAPPYTTAGSMFPWASMGIGYQAYQLTVDAGGDLIVSDGDTVDIAKSPYSTLTQILSEGPPSSPGGNSNFPFGLSP